jgi:hypothetical protein
MRVKHKRGEVIPNAGGTAEYVIPSRSISNCAPGLFSY